jgi:signal transduction histidine kinase
MFPGPIVTAEPWFRIGDSDEIGATERSVGVLRVFLAVAGLIAISVDSTQPALYTGIAYTTLALYVVLAAVILVTSSFFIRKAPRTFAVAAHTMDVSVAAAVMLCTEGPDSPFFVFLTFPLLVAAYRWGLRETLVTAAAALMLLPVSSLLIGSTLPVASSVLAGSFSVNRLIMRSTYVVIASVLVGYLAEKEKQRRREAVALGELMSRTRADAGLGGTLQALLGSLAQLFRAPRALLAVEETSSGRLFLLRAETGYDGRPPVFTSTEIERWKRPTYWFEMPGDSCYGVLPLKSNVCAGIAVDEHERRLGGRWTIPELFLSAHPCRSILTVSITSNDEWTGRVFLLDSNAGLDREDTLRFARRLVFEIGPSIDQISLINKLRSRAESIERARLARELHDGPIQTLASAEMQLDVLARHEATPVEVANDLDDIQILLRNEVMNLRDLTQDMKIGLFEIDTDGLFGDVSNIVERFERQTGIAAEFVSEPQLVKLPSRSRREVLRIVHEGLVNVRKHSGARHVVVHAAVAGRNLELSIADDGRGFDFEGRLTERELAVRHKGPEVIRECVKQLGGMMAVVSNPGRGARVEVRVPIPTA